MWKPGFSRERENGITFAACVAVQTMTMDPKRPFVAIYKPRFISIK
jgi:hypothetical protein